MLDIYFIIIDLHFFPLPIGFLELSFEKKKFEVKMS